LIVKHGIVVHVQQGDVDKSHVRLSRWKQGPAHR
jgi:hypothetical protein